MKLQQAKILLEKINALNKSMDLDRGAIAPIERDLMLSYIRQLYEVFLDADQQVRSGNGGDQSSQREVSGPQDRPRPEPIRRNTYKPPRIIEIPDREEPEEKPSIQPAPPQPPKEEKPKPEPNRPRSEAPKVTPPREEPAPSVADHSELQLLFEQRKATELSEKLSESPISDLTRAMSINDRLLFMNQLFAKDMNQLDETLRQLNRFGNMEEAKPLLFDLAQRHDWLDEEKQDTAKTFIKMVRRRYI